MEEKEWPCCCSPKRHHQISQSYQWRVNISKETNLIEKNKKSTMILLCRSFLWEFLDVDARMSSHVEMRRADEGIYYANEVAPRSPPQVIWLIKWQTQILKMSIILQINDFRHVWMWYLELTTTCPLRTVMAASFLSCKREQWSLLSLIHCCAFQDLMILISLIME